MLNEVRLGDVSYNLILNKIFTCINDRVFKYIKNLSNEKAIIDACDQRIHAFSPDISPTASFFGNEIDDIDIKNKRIGEISHEVYSLLLKNIELKSKKVINKTN